MTTKNNRTQGNDQVIADFFKKSVWIILLAVIIIATIYFIKNRKQEVKVQEQEFQAPVKLSQKIDPPVIRFSEQAKQRGIDFVQENGAMGERMLPETMGSGVGFIDFDNDGDEDIVFSNGTRWQWDEVAGNATQKLYQNDGKGYFSDVSKEKGIADSYYGTGIAVGDVNQDGFDDIFIAAVGKNHLYINQMGEKFTESEAVLDCTENGWSTSSGFFDYDNDGDLDLMVLNYVQWSKELDLAADYKIDGLGRAYGPPSNFPGTHSCLFENDNGTFKDVSEESGIIIRNPATGDFEGKSLALTFLDINSDGYQDIIVANDTTRNFVFINQQDKTFKENGSEVGLAYDSSGKATGAMGLDSSHYLNDEDLAVTVGNFANEMTSFYVNRSNLGFFTDETVITGVGPQSRLALSFGLFFFDYDSDGRMDLFQTNGHVENEISKVQSAQRYAQKSQLFWNCSEKCERPFIPVTSAGDLTEMDLVGRAAAYGDIDNDGDLDIVVTQVARPPVLFINQNEMPKNWIGIRLSSTKGNVSGAEITVHTENNIQKFLYSPTRSYLSQMQKGQIIGLGSDKLVKVMISYHGGVKSVTDLTNNDWNLISLD